MGGKICIRRATEVDFAGILEMKGIIGEKNLPERIARMHRGELEYLVAEQDGQIVGHILLEYQGIPTAPDYPHISDAFVAEGRRSRGAGTLLIQACEQYAMEKGCSRIGLSVNPTDNPRAKALYERLGYRATGDPPYLDDVYDGWEEWVIDMVKSLRVDAWPDGQE